MGHRFITSESVTEGHPDKLCDQISDGILDAFLARDPAARVAVEAMASGNTLFVAGEVTSTATVDIAETARRVIREVGYLDPALGFDAESCLILTDLHTQSPDIDLGVTRGGDLGAGDQGVFYGFACDETESLMPEAIDLAHRLSFRLAQARRSGGLGWLRPDGKTQVTMRCDADGRPVAVTGVIVSAQHAPEIDRETLVRGLIEEVVVPGLGRRFERGIRILINPTGRFVLGGPAGDTGLTGRKLMVDTYGGCVRHGGGAFSGKDPTKVDRSAAYMARWVAKTVVAAGLAQKCEVALAFAIGQREPEMVSIETFGTEAVDVERLVDAVREVFPLSVSGMIEALQLRRPVFRTTAAYGHFGRTGEAFTWEKTDRADALCRAMGCRPRLLAET